MEVARGKRKIWLKSSSLHDYDNAVNRVDRKIDECVSDPEKLRELARQSIFHQEIMQQHCNDIPLFVITTELQQKKTKTMKSIPPNRLCCKS